MQNNFNLQKEIKDKTTEKFHTLKKDDTKYFIAEDKLGNKKFYLGKKHHRSRHSFSRRRY